MYQEVLPVERLAFYWGATDGWPKIDPDRLGDGQLVTVTLTPDGEARTEMRFHIVLPQDWSDDEMRVCRQGWSETVDRLVVKFAAQG